MSQTLNDARSSILAAIASRFGIEPDLEVGDMVEWPCIRPSDGRRPFSYAHDVMYDGWVRVTGPMVYLGPLDVNPVPLLTFTDETIHAFFDTPSGRVCSFAGRSYTFRVIRDIVTRRRFRGCIPDV